MHEPLFETSETRCSRSGAALVLSLVQARPRISTDVLRAIERAIAEAEQRALALVIASANEHFAFGADLDDALTAAQQGRPNVLEAALHDYQRVMLRVRHAAIPVVAAVRGYAVSGGCELLMHCARVVAHDECRIGLLEPSAGVVPSGGGLKEFARRASEHDDLRSQVLRAFETISVATLARSAQEAQQLGFLTSLDRVDATAPASEAVAVAEHLLDSGFAPLAPDPMFRIGGKVLLDEIRVVQERKLIAVELTLHQFEINMRIAAVLCGGHTAATTATEAEILALERDHFVALALMPLSQARYAHLQATGKRLMN